MSFAEWVLDGLSYGKPLNLFTDVLFSPIHVFTMTEIIIRAIEADLSGLYNCSSKDVISKYDYGMEMARIFNFSNENIKKTCLEDMHFLAKRSKNMALSSVKLSSALGFNMPSAIESIKILKNEFDFTTKIKK
jgi:dTDP-4-dehydrorhamnose reductase